MTDVNPVAVVGLAAIMPMAPDGDAFWANITGGRYCITEVTPDRWDSALYYSPDHSARDKTYSIIGGWVREFEWDPIRWRLPIPPTVAAQMDEGQRWALSAARRALMDAGWPNWSIDSERVAVILGNAIGGEKHYKSSMRIQLPEALKRLEESATLRSLSPEAQRAIIEETRAGYLDNMFEITEDTMPGELSNVIAGRIANVLNLRGPNYTTDAACASGLAALNSAILGLNDHQYDAVITGGIDRNMGVDAFVKFCKIGALSATGTRPFDAGADGFVMGEGAALFVLKRLEDAERDGDKIYSVILSVGGSSDGKGKGITAPNPVGQKLAVARAWERAGVDPSTASAIEAHGTSTSVGDATELESLTAIFGAAGAKPGSIALGSVKSNIGHLKASAGTAGLFKMVKSLHEKVLAPSLNFVNPNPNVDWDTAPCAVNTTLRPWPTPEAGIRRGGVSAFGFGGTNFHVVVEEHVPGRHKPRPKVYAAADVPGAGAAAGSSASAPVTAYVAAPRKTPLRGALVLGGRDDADLLAQVQTHLAAAKAGTAPAPAAPDPALANAPVRVAVDYGSAEELAGKLDKLAKGLASGNPAIFKMLRQQGVFLGRGPAPKLAFLYTGQGSQYVNMLRELHTSEPIVRSTFDEADRVMTPLLGRSLTSFIYVDGNDEAAVKAANKQLMQTEITQPAVLATDLSLTRLLAAYGIKPDMVMGHSLGEYGALVAAGSLTLDSAMEAVSARGREMASISVEDNGAMAAVFGPLAEIEKVVAAAEGYVVIANINSYSQAVVGGATKAVEKVVETFLAMGMNAVRIPVSHAFHTSIVAEASVPFGNALRRLDMRPPVLPIIANVTGEFYPSDATTETMLDFAGKQIASPVQFVKGLQTLYAAGARVFVEVGPKKALHGFVEDVLGSKHDDVLALFTNHPKLGDAVAVNQALCGLYAAGHGFAPVQVPVAAPAAAPSAAPAAPAAAPASSAPVAPAPRAASASAGTSDEVITELGKLFAGVLEQGMSLYYGAAGAAPGAGGTAYQAPVAAPEPTVEYVPAQDANEPVVITGAALGLPGVERTFDDENIARILGGQQFIQSLPQHVRQRMADMRITRLVKDASGGGSFKTIDDPADVIKLAGKHAPLDVVEQFAIDNARDQALDNASRLAIGAGFDALRDAGIPLVMRYKTTTLGTQLPDRWGLPESMRDDTGVVFASAFPGYDRFAEAIEDYALDRGRRDNLLALHGLRARLPQGDPALSEVDALIAELTETIEKANFQFDRRFLFRALSMGHSQFAEIIGARGPNTQVNAACASTTQAAAVAEDWIRSGRCRRVVVISADDATSDNLLPWITAGFLASGAAATDERVEDAATPFDRRRHGMIVGMGAGAFVVESAEAARERGLQPICEVLGTVIANSAFHGSRLDVGHIGGVMETLVSQVEQRGLRRDDIADKMVFISHETYTPARGGSAAAEINALRGCFGANAGKIVITNTKGFTGHAMGAGIEDVVAIKALETGIVPPVPNYKEPDPDLGVLNLSTGGPYPIQYALRLAAGFGSQVAMTLTRWTPMPDGRRRAPHELGYAYRIIDQAAWQRWLDSLSGHSNSVLEVDHRRLRIVDVGAPATPVVPKVRLAIPYAGRMGAPTRGTTGYAGVPAPAAPTAAAPMAAPAHTPAPAVAPAAPVAAAPAAAAPPAPVTTPDPPAAPTDPVLDQVTAIVSGLTGYPADLLDPDLDLEADLGVDTVKQAEVFAAVREHYQVERDDTMKLRDFPTLRHVAGWVRAKAGLPEPSAAPVAAAAPVSSGAAPTAAPSAGVVSDPVLDQVTQIVAGLTGYPADLLDPDLDLEADLGVDTVKQAEVFAAVREHYQVERDDTMKLRDFPTLRHVAGWVRAKAGLPEPTVAAAAPAAAPAGPAATAVAPVPAPAADAGDPVIAKVTEIVAGLTGYPADLLDPDLDLEADLGVDTVKQAEVFAAVREHYQVERDDTMKLRDFPTLRHVAGWVRGKAGLPAYSAPTAAPAAAPAAATAPAPAAPAAPAAAAADPVMEKVTEIVADLTGYPADLLDPDLDLEADLGVDTVKQAEVFAAVRAHYGVERDDTMKLRDFPTLRHVAGWVRGKAGLPEPSAAPVAAAASAAPASAAPVAAAAPAGAPAASPGADDVMAKVIEIVAELTGYPADLLDPDLDLEADLGVDTVKQAEVFAAVRAHYDVERDDSLKLRDFPTIKHVAGWVRSKAGLPEPSAAPAAVPTAAPVAAPAPSSAQAAAPAATPGADEVMQKVIDIVAELTGYPADLLDPDLDLEADLGVDTVKQAEVFAAVRAHYDVERDDSLKLRDFPTIKHVAGWVRSKAGLAAPAGAPAAGAPTTPAATPAAPAHPAPEVIQGSLTAIDALPRRLPVAVVRPDLAACVPTDVELKGARVIVMPDEGGVGEALVKRLAKAGATALTLPAGIPTEQLSAQLDEWLAEGPIAGVYWLPALDDEGDHAALDLATWTELLRRRVKTLYTTMRRMWDDSPFLVSATRLGGRHGYDAQGATSPMGGAVTGFTKSYKKERPEALVKAVDLPASRKTAALADLLLEETLRDPGAVEVGHTDGLRWGVAFAEVPFPALQADGSPDGEGGMALTPDSVFLVTGAAGSIVSAITADLAKGAGGGTFHLLDLTPTPDAADPDLAAFRTNKDGLKASLAARMKERGERPTPVVIDKELARIERLAAALTAIQAVEAAGGTVHYHSVDLTNADAVAAVMADVRERSGRIDVLLHAAGLEISRNLPQKEPREYDLVFDVKTTGWFNVWSGAAGMPVGAVVVFSSVAGRFGNQGQTDYSAANDLLCKITSSLRHTRPETRGLALDWTAWGGIGMATRGSIPKIMEMAGVQMLPPDAGVAWIRRELTASAYSGEVVVAGVLGMMAAEYHETGGFDAAALRGGKATGPMIGEVTGSVHHGLVVTTTLDPAQQPFLYDHRIDGTPVLPGVMGMESFAEAAALIAPEGYRVDGLEEVDFLAPVKFFRDQPRTLTITAKATPAAEGSDLLVRCTLTADRTLPGQSAPVTTTHFVGTVRLTKDDVVAQSRKVPKKADGAKLDGEQVYTFYFHGPAYQVVSQAWRSGGGSVTKLVDPLPDNHVPADAPLVSAPRLAELCFQTSGLWEAGTEGRMALPTRVGRVRVLLDPAAAEGPLHAIASPTGESTFDCVVVDRTGAVIMVMDGYESIAFPAPIPDSVVTPLRETYQP